MPRPKISVDKQKLTEAVHGTAKQKKQSDYLSAVASTYHGLTGQTISPAVVAARMKEWGLTGSEIVAQPFVPDTTENLPLSEEIDYGKTGAVKVSKEKMKHYQRLLREALETMGFYETMSCLANACIDISKSSTNEAGKHIWRQVTETIDEVVGAVRKL